MGNYLIFGARGGIGEALARKLADQGHDLTLTSRQPNQIAEGLGKAVACDVTDLDQVESAVAAATEQAPLDGLAYCVGSIVLKPLKAAKEADYIDAFRVNLLGAAQAVKAAERSLKQAKGSVVMFSTVAVAQGFPNHAVIASAKGAVEGLGKSLAAELSPNVRVNVIAPSLTDTEIAKPLTGNDNMRDAIAKMHPIPRLGTAEDSANAAAFLLSGESSWITGQVIGVDGGRSSLRNKG
ncbi:MAG: SDR family oxidoreductase [Alphaproteobacteria bacterium]